MAPSGTPWSAIGPAPIVNGQDGNNNPVTGRITGIAADPTDANTIFLASAGGGVWKTTNATSANPTWTPLTDNLTDGSGKPLPEFMGAIAETRDASSNEIVYAGTGEANNSGDSFYGEGILVSQDGGSTWTLTTAGGAFAGKTVSKIVIDPSDPTGASAYAAIADFGVNGQVGSTGIWKTTNFGATWTNTTAANGLSSFDPWSDVVIDPLTPSTVYAAEGNSFGANGNGVYKSTNGGGTWNLLSNGPTGNGAGRIALAVYDDGATNELLVSVSTPGGQLSEVVESLDGGNTFTTLTNVPNYMGRQGWYDTTLAIDPKDPLFMYAGGADSGASGNIESFDGGNNWQGITTDSLGNGPHSDDHAVAFDANGNMLDGNDGGIYRLDNPTNKHTQSWDDLNTNLQITQFTGIALDPSNAAVAYGGSQDNGTEKYTGSTGWTQLLDGDGGITRVDPTDDLRIYQEFFNVSLDVSNNGGATFNSITRGIVGAKNDFYVPYVLDSLGNIYYGTDYLNFSSNQGGSWTQIGTPNQNNFNPADAPIDAIAVAPLNNNVVYVSAGGHLFVTQNAQNGTASNVSWTQIDLPGGAGAGGHNSLAVDPADATGATAYAVVNAFGGGHVFKTVNFGATWTNISGNLPNTPVSSIAVDPRGTGALYLGTDIGVYYSPDGSASWAPFGTGFPNVQVVELDLAPTIGLMGAGTHGRGMYEMPFNGTMTWVLDAGGPHNFRLVQSGAYYDLYDNNILVETQQEALTTGFDIGAHASVDNSLTIDDSGGNITLPITFDGGTGSGTHTLTIENASPAFTSATYTFTNSNSGSITLGSASPITFSDTTSVVNTTSEASVTFNLTAGAQGTLQGAGGTTVSLTTSNNSFTSTTFPNPSSSLTVNATGGNSLITLAAMNNAFGAGSETLTGQNSGDVFRLTNITAFPNTTSLTLTSATLDLNGLGPTIDGLNGDANAVITDGISTAASLTIGANNSGGTYSGAINDGSSGNTSLIKDGSATEVLSGTSSYTGTTTVNVGTLQVDGTLTCDVIVNGGTLDGIGSVYPITGAGGTVAPGDGTPGTLTSGALKVPAGSAFNVQIGGQNNGQYSQDNVSNGVISLGGKLNLYDFNNYQPQNGDVYTIINNTPGTGVTGFFVAGAGADPGIQNTVLTEGAVISNNFLGSGEEARISYQGPNNSVIIKITPVDLITSPTSVNVMAGSSASFTASSSLGSPPDSVQWQVNRNDGNGFVNDTTDSGATTTTLTVSNTTAAENGYQYQAVFSNIYGNFASNPATLGVDYVSQPPPLTVCAFAGQNAVITALSSDPGAPTNPDHVQWQVNSGGGFVNDTTDNGNNTTTLIVLATAADNNYQYQAVFTNPSYSGSVTSITSAAATLIVDSTITSPQNVTVFAGATATFTAAVSDPTNSDSLQWQVSTNNGGSWTNLGVTTSPLSFSATTGENGNLYRAVFSNSSYSGGGQALVLGPVSLTVDYIVTQPSSTVAVFAGYTATITAAAANPNDAVQWQVSSNNGPFTNVPAPAGNNATLSLSNVQISWDQNQYEATFTNSYPGSATTNLTTLRVDYITTEPTDQTAFLGQNATFTVVSNNPLGPSDNDQIQWQVFSGNTWSNIPGATNSSLVVAATANDNLSQYRAIITNSNETGSATSNTVTLHVDSLTNPTDQVAFPGQTATFTASSTNNADSVQWYYKAPTSNVFQLDTTDNGADTNTLQVAGVQISQDGYQYEAVFSNTYGSSTTNAATLHVDHVITPPASIEVFAGSNATFTAAVANPNGKDTVQWWVNRQDGNNFVPDTVDGGNTTMTLTVTSTTSAENGYQYMAVFMNPKYGGSLSTNPVTLTVDYITEQPKLIVAAFGGQNAQFTASSSNPSDLVQWQVNRNDGHGFVNDTVDQGAATTTLTVAAVQAAEDSYQYRAIFTNAYPGSATTTAETLRVDHVTTNPSNTVTVFAGQTATFTAASLNPLQTDNIQWQVFTSGNWVNDTTDSGANSLTLTVANVLTTQDRSQYRAMFTNPSYGGSAITTTATLRVDSVLTNPQPVAVEATQTATFSATAVNPSGTDLVQWQVNTGTGTFVNISGATTTTLTIANTITGENGYQYRAVFTNNSYSGSATSNAATLTVTPAPSLSAPSATQWTVNEPNFTSTITIVGGTAPFFLTGSSGLPPGLAVNFSNTTITISGKPTQVGTFPTVKFTVKDAVNVSTTATFSFIINPQVSLGPTLLAPGTTNANYDQFIAAVGGTGNKTVTYASGVVNQLSALGLTITPSPASNTLEITSNGVPPTAAGTVTFNVTASDGTGSSATASYTVRIVKTATLVPDFLSPGETMLVIPDNNGTIIQPVDVSGNNLSVTVGGVYEGTFKVNGHILVYGSGNGDAIHMKLGPLSTSVIVPAFLIGGNGGETLDAGGSSANNVLLGGNGKNVLTGGSGRDILIGGPVYSVLYGGHNEDVLVSGTTTYGQNIAALNALMAEWASGDSLNTRMTDLVNGGGANGSYVLNGTTVMTDLPQELIVPGSVTSENLIINATQLIGPAGTVTSSASYSVPFSWGAVNGKDHYTFLLVDETTNQTVLSNNNVSGTSLTLSNAQNTLIAGHSYRWWVQPVSATGQLGVLSSPANFKVV